MDCKSFPKNHTPTEASVERINDFNDLIKPIIDELDAQGISYDDPQRGLGARGVLPLWAQVPFLGNIESPNLVNDYYGSTRRLVKERLLPQAA